MKVITESLLNEVSSQAKDSERLRMNYNFHVSLDESLHRMLNAMEPGTFIPAHRHQNPDRVEIYIVLKGSLVAVGFNEEGKIMSRTQLGPASGNYGIEIPPGTWHSLAVLEPNTVIYEVKEGPYVPIVPENIAPWSPDPIDEIAVKKFIDKLCEGI